MVVLYVTSPEVGTGKTTICAGIGKHLLENGRRVGFLKLTTADNAADSDAAFMRHIFALEEPVGSIFPIIDNQDNRVSKIKEAYDRVSPGKDIVIIEGEANLGGDSQKIVEALNARVIVVTGYSKELPPEIYKDFGEHLLGVVLNKVPKGQLERVQNELSAQLGEAGINILGVLPEDRVLFALTVGELAKYLQGEMLNGDENSTELVENFMLGAMYVGSGSEYFGRKSNKAVVVRGERADMQLAAMETSTRCLVLSNDMTPVPVVLHRAEDKKVPIILTRENIINTVTSIEEALDKTRFNQEKKLPRLTEIMGQHFNFQAVSQGLGLAE